MTLKLAETSVAKSRPSFPYGDNLFKSENYVEVHFGQVVQTYVPLSPSSITWYRPRGGDALRLGRLLQAWRKVMSACRRVDDL